jgi:hypothetical protein
VQSPTIHSKKVIFLAAVVPGLYPIIFYYSKNFPLINSWEHLGFFIVTFLLVPTASFFVLNAIFKLKYLRPFQKYLLPFLNIFTFLYLLKVCFYIGIEKDKTLIAFLIAAVLALFMYQHLLKIIALEFILAIVGLFSLVGTATDFMSISEDWRTQPDAIAEVSFNGNPNVYLIQADGYANFSELNRGFYNFDNNEFEQFLQKENFTFYPNYRSNYSTTVESNVALFDMKHHYYNKSIGYNEIYNGRNMIISDNIVLNAFKNNDYKTYFLTETPYLMANRPKMGYDVTNLPYSDIKYIRNGAKRITEIEKPLQQYSAENIEEPKFFFIQLLNPWHVTSVNNSSKNKETERETYLKKIQETNKILTRSIRQIKATDPQGLIILMSDHGGFVGMAHTGEKRTKNLNRDFQYSIFGANLAIHWPNENPPEFDVQIKSSVNLFRVVFAYLSKNQSYLDHLQENGSYLIIKEDAEDGIYQTIDDTGTIVFKPLKDLPF